MQVSLGKHAFSDYGRITVTVYKITPLADY